MPEERGGTLECTEINVISGVAAVRKRPAMYLSRGNCNGTGILQAALEEFEHYGTNLQVFAFDDRFEIIEDGPAWDPEVEGFLVFDTPEKFSGISTLVALSTTLEYTAYREGRIWEQSFQEGTPMTALMIVGNTSRQGAQVVFKLDPTVGVDLKVNFNVLRKAYPKITFRDCREAPV